jgi:hypothetical protein
MKKTLKGEKRTKISISQVNKKTTWKHFRSTLSMQDKVWFSQITISRYCPFKHNPIFSLSRPLSFIMSLFFIHSFVCRDRQQKTVITHYKCPFVRQSKFTYSLYLFVCNTMLNLCFECYGKCEQCSRTFSFAFVF